MEVLEPLEARNRCWKQAMETRRNAGVMSDAILPRLSKKHRPAIINIIHEMAEVSSLFTDCADLVLVYKERVYLISDYIEILTPSTNKTNRYLWEALQDKDFLKVKTAEYKWEKLLLKMKEETNTSLHNLFGAYKSYLTEVVHLLHRPSLLNPANLNEKAKKIMLYLAWQGIEYGYRPPNAPHPSEVGIQVMEVHWAQELFQYDKKMIPFPRSVPPNQSQCYDVSSDKAANEVPKGAIILFRMTFNSNRLAVVVYLKSAESDKARMWCRWTGEQDEEDSNKLKQPMYASQGLHGLRMEREKTSLVLECYNDRKERPETWLQLYFQHWEEMVLFHDAVVSLKFCCPDTVECDPEELMLKKEKVLFKAPFADMDYDHVLTIYTSNSSGGARLAASVRSGEWKRIPAWTAFLGKLELKKDHIKRKNDRTVVISKLDPLLTCRPDYYDGPLKGKSGYAIKFRQGSDADEFVEVWKDLVRSYDPRKSP